MLAKFQGTSVTQNNIYIDNFVNEEIITYSLILLRGHIDPTNTGKENVFLDANGYKTTTTLCGNKFKFLIDLQKESNQITIGYESKLLELNLNYRPRVSTYSVLPLYVICAGHNGRFQAPSNQNNSPENACARIALTAKILQCVCADRLYAQVSERKTFHLDDECQIFHSKLGYSQARTMSQTELWEYVGREIMQSEIAKEDRKYLAFLSCTKYCGDKYNESLLSHEDIISITECYVALGGGGLALFGSACLYTWPDRYEHILMKLRDETLVDKTQFMDDSSYRGTLGACFSTTLGAVLHELCHAFDLGHTEKGIMGRGFDVVHKIFAWDIELDSKESNYYKNLEFNESIKPTTLLERLADRKKNSRVKSTLSSECNAEAMFWTKHCAIILKYHRWFNNNLNTVGNVLKFDSANRVITSTAGLRVVEIRRTLDEMVVHDWIFNTKVLKYSFQIDHVHLQREPSILFVEDNIGTILKRLV